MLSDIVAGLSYIKGNQMVLVLLVMGLATTLLASPFRMLLPVFVVDVYGKGPDSMGLLVAIMGGGSLVGSLAIAALGNWRRGMLLIVGSFASGIALLLIAAFPFYYAAAAIMLLVGLGDSGRRTINMGLIMEVVEDQYRGRVMSVFMMNFGLMPLGMLPAGLAVDYFGGPIAIGILGGLLLAVAAAVLLTQKRLREFQ
jgi:predicted MFS family arabinose efflux permease